MKCEIFSIETVLVREEQGEKWGYSIFAIQLPGCATQGDTIEEAIENMKEAFTGVVLSYWDHGKEIPWRDNWPEGVFDDERSIRRNIMVEVKEE